MNRHLKRLIEKALRRTGVAAAVRTVWRKNALVLAYHNVVPDGESVTGDLGLHLPQREFARQLDWLSRTHDVVPLSAILETPREGSRPRAAITFDDAYRGAVTVGVTELAARNLPATIFVAPGLIGHRGFWWDLLAAGRAGGLPPEVREHCLEELDGCNDRIMDWAAKRDLLASALPPHQVAATQDELARCAGSGRITFGSHTWSHPNLRRLDGPGLRNELERPLDWLSARFTQVIPWLAYPYGISSTAAEAAAGASGYQGALLVQSGGITHSRLNEHRYALPRVNVPAAVSLDGFALRASLYHGFEVPGLR